METNTDYLLIASLGIKLYEGNIVSIKRFPDEKWITRHGWYNYESKYYKGWYFSSLVGDQIFPAIQSDLDEIVVLSTASDQEGPTLPVDPDNPPEPYEPTTYLNDTYFPVSEKQILKLVDGNIVSIETFPDVKWVLHKGWYTFDNKLNNGWYLTSLVDKSVRPVIPQEIEGMVVISTKSNNLDPNYPNVLPISAENQDVEVPTTSYQQTATTISSTSPYGPIFPPVAPDDELVPYQVKSAFVTFPDIEARDKLDTRQIPDGKLVRVNDVDGKTEYYAWSINANDWVDVNFVFEERAIIAGDGITDGGTLADDVTITHGPTGTGHDETLEVSDTRASVMSAVTIDHFGHVESISEKDITDDIKGVVMDDDRFAKSADLARWIVY